MNSSKCRLCGSEDINLDLKVREYDLWRCIECLYAQILPLPEEDEISKIYAPDYFLRGKYKNDTAGRKEQDRRIHLLKEAGLQKGDRILDFGCATGDFLAIADDRFSVWGTDISEAAITAAQKRLPHIADYFRLWRDGEEIFEERFDCIVMWDVVEHLADPEAVVKDLMAMLKPGGIIALSTPNIGALTAKIMGKYWAFMTPPEHLGFFDRDCIFKFMSAHVGEVIHWSSLGKWVNLGFLFYKLRKMFPDLLSPNMVNFIQISFLSRICLFVPTGDIHYIVARNQK